MEEILYGIWVYKPCKHVLNLFFEVAHAENLVRRERKHVLRLVFDIKHAEN